MLDQDKESSLQVRFIKLLLDSGALLTGDFKLKSGRRSSYFINLGVIPDGSTIFSLGQCFAEKIVSDVGESQFDLLFGPAYKGIPIALSTSIALYHTFGIHKSYAFNRKVQKEYGEMSLFLGGELNEGGRVLIVDDVITDGGTKYETIDLLTQHTNVKIVGVLVGVDRSENPEVCEIVRRQTKLPLWSIISIEQIREFMNKK